MNLSLDYNFFKDLFHEFYTKVLFFKNMALTKDNLTLEQVNGMMQTLTDILSDQERIISNNTNAYVYSIYKELQYLMAGFADEIFLELNWSVAFQKHWSNRLIESKLFDSHVAGELIFNKIDTIISNHEDQNLLIPIYITVLSLGFYGKYRMDIVNHEEPQIITQYKKMLFDLMYHVNKMNIAKDNALFPDSKNYTVINKNIIRNSTFLLWSGILAGILITYSIISYTMWSHQTDIIYAIINNILNTKN